MFRFVFVIGQTIAKPVARLKRKLLITTAGRLPFCSWPRLRVERERDEVALFGNIGGHLPFFLPDWLTKTFFAHLII